MEKLLTPEELCELMQVKLPTLYKWVHYGYCPHIKLGRFLRFREADIQKWLEERSHEGRATVKVDLDEGEM